MKGSVSVSFILFFPTIISLKIYKSKMEHSNPKMISGLVYKKFDLQNAFKSNDFSVCMRANIKRLAQDNSATLLKIGGSDDAYAYFLRLVARDTASWINFGNPINMGWILRDPMMEGYLIWKINEWHHFCFSYSESKSYMSFVKVSEYSKMLLQIWIRSSVSTVVEFHSEACEI